jgi:hypothetical protein
VIALALRNRYESGSDHVDGSAAPKEPH